MLTRFGNMPTSAKTCMILRLGRRKTAVNGSSARDVVRTNVGRFLRTSRALCNFFARVLFADEGFGNVRCGHERDRLACQVVKSLIFVFGHSRQPELREPRPQKKSGVLSPERMFVNALAGDRACLRFRTRGLHQVLSITQHRLKGPEKTASEET